MRTQVQRPHPEDSSQGRNLRRQGGTLADAVGDLQEELSAFHTRTTLDGSFLMVVAAFYHSTSAPAGRWCRSHGWCLSICLTPEQVWQTESAIRPHDGIRMTIRPCWGRLGLKNRLSWPGG